MNEVKVARPVLHKRKWPYPLIWILPAIVALLAGIYMRDYLSHRGPEIIIGFSDSSDIVEGQTRVLYRGAEIGRVTSVSLSKDRRHSLVTARLDKDESIFATKGASFWIVRPEIAQWNLKGLDALMGGAYIHATPGQGEESSVEFEGMAREPRIREPGERFILTSSRLGHVQDGSMVSYKGIAVGSIEEIELAKDASHVDIHAVVWTRYAHLVRENSKFWLESGLDFKGGIFSGIHLTLDSLQTLASGGVAFATPENEIAPQAKNGRQFPLENETKKEWQQWSPRIGSAARVSTHAQSQTTVSNF